MKITNSEVIKGGERELMDVITADLDWSAIEGIFREQNRLEIGEDVEYRHGDIVVHDNQIVYELEFEVKVAFSILLDRDGNCISVKNSTKTSPDDVTESKNGYEEALKEMVK